MKTGYLTLIFALACAACTPRFYPPKVDVPDGYLYGEGFPRDAGQPGNPCAGERDFIGGKCGNAVHGL